ncbi:DNA polymerase III subunit alpha [Kordiimonas sp. SCSIO 12603]|uniref:DNA polymerase III subunit alpha n=1 Tax=Kordiimonas sp. SCSIO 12603 TaxID=2829596 RepID=UPI0021071456|nr:DNA polymerase III subunit alpha [Kordiimonas sp. SCSIO 12603]UTW57487.1 DNA polymerase III subunit alpha [Kordiimonas sp. SCSIO 12603]
MNYADFVHLRVHTAYSLSEGAIHVKDLVKQCVGHKMPAVAMTDTNNMFAALEFSSAGTGMGIQPIIGVTLTVKNPYRENKKGGKVKEQPEALVLLAQNEEGYQNLMKIVSKAHLESDVQVGVQFPVSGFNGFSEGIICLTGGANGPIGRLIRDGKNEDAENLLLQLKEYFGDRLYVELQRHGEEFEEETEEVFLDLAYEHNVPIVATNQPYFAGPDMYQPHDALLCMADSTYVAVTDRRKLNAEYRFKTAEEMKELFKDLPEAYENTVNIAKRCRIKIDPIDPLLPNFTQGMDVSEADMLRQESEVGLRERLDFKAKEEGLTAGKDQEWEKEYWERLDFELGIINQMGFPGYFLIVADFIQWAKDHDIPVGPGRGSGAGSVVAWVLKITDLDPLRFSLLFERFLNPERVSMPDFDIDFCQDKRELVIRYVQEKYGADRVAQIITFGKLQARMVVKSCGRVLQQHHGATDRLSKMIPNDPGNAMTLQEALDSEPRLQREVDSDELTAKVIERALKLEGFYAHSSTHAAGVVIGDRPLDQLVPLYRDPKSDMPVTQFNMKWVELAGLVKFDFLGLKTLTVLDRAVKYIKARDIHIDLAEVPLTDGPAYELLQAGESAGVFQLESTGMRAVLKGLKPDKFEDIIAIVALYRPGPMDNIPTYVDRKHGRLEVEYPHPILEDILGETYGVIIYQEQVMQIAQVMSGYSLGEADILRRAMGKKIKEEMDKQRGRFCEGAVERGIDYEKASYIFDLVTKFASYGFNKSHAAAYALVSYHTAYLKANFPVEFMAAIMTLDMGNTDKLAAFKMELQRMEIPLLLPDINHSDVPFTVEAAPEVYCEGGEDPRHNLAVRYALGAIKGVGEKAMEAIVEERKANGPYKDMFDFAERIDPKLVNKRQMERLAAAGAFDGLLPNRAQAHAAAEILMRTAQMEAKERESSQVSLFGGDLAATVERPTLPIVKSWTDTEQLDEERKAIGFYISAHPLDTYETVLERERIVPAKEVYTDPGLITQTVRMAGAILGYREGMTKRGNKFGRLTLSDRTDAFELMAFEDDLDRMRQLVEEGAPMVVSVQIRKRDDDDSIGLSCRGMESLEHVASQSSKGLFIEVEEANAFPSIKAALDRKAGGKGAVIVRVPVAEDKRFAEFRLTGKYKVTPELKQAIAAEMGVLSVEEI